MARPEYAYNEHLQELHSSDFEMAKGEPDIRNWKVIGLQNQEVGKVEELLFSNISHRVRYLIMNINGKPLNLVSRSVLVPIGLVDLLRDEKIVLLKGINISHLASLPLYENGKISRETELAIRDVFSPGNGSIYDGRELTDDEEFYNHEYYNNERFAHPTLEVPEKKSVKEEIQENLERVKESVNKMENDINKLGRSGL